MKNIIIVVLVAMIAYFVGYNSNKFNGFDSQYWYQQYDEFSELAVLSDKKYQELKSCIDYAFEATDEYAIIMKSSIESCYREVESIY